MFFFKPKPIYIDCFTFDSAVYEYAPIASANNFIPNWWKELPKGYQEGLHEISTIKRCAGFIDLYSKGLMLPAWSDFAVETFSNGNYLYDFAHQAFAVINHPQKQVGTFYNDSDSLHIKIETPWLFKCSTDINWFYSQPVWNQLAGRDFCIPSGVVNYKYQNETNLNILFRRKDQTVNFKHGEPLAHIIPLTERPFKINNHLLDEAEYKKMKNKGHPTMFTNNYFKRKKIQQAKEAKESKCPFNF